MSSADQIYQWVETKCQHCGHLYQATFTACPKCHRRNPKETGFGPLWGSMAKNPQIAVNIERLVEFDQRYRKALSTRSAEEMRKLAAWAEAHRMSLARKAIKAAEELQ